MTYTVGFTTPASLTCTWGEDVLIPFCPSAGHLAEFGTVVYMNAMTMATVG